jgi:hypothetical protein
LRRTSASEARVQCGSAGQCDCLARTDEFSRREADAALFFRKTAHPVLKRTVIPKRLVEQWSHSYGAAAGALEQRSAFEVFQIASNGGDGCAECRAKLVDFDTARFLKAAKNVFVTRDEVISLARHMGKRNKADSSASCVLIYHFDRTIFIYDRDAVQSSQRDG